MPPGFRGALQVEAVPAVPVQGGAGQRRIAVAAEDDRHRSVTRWLRVDADGIEGDELTLEGGGVLAPEGADRGDVLDRTRGAGAERPPQSRSSVAACLATSTGLCSGRRRTPVASEIVLVAAAAKPRHPNGSSQSASAAIGMAPSSL